MDELDKLAAEKVMGRMPHDCNVYRDKNGFIYWQPTRDIAQAWELLEKLNHAYQIYHYNDGVTEVMIYDPDQGPIGGKSKKVVAEAITKACLKAVGVEL